MTRIRATEGGDVALTSEEEAARDLEEAAWLEKAPARESKERARARRAAYGPLADQLDMMYFDMIDSTTTWPDHIASVKARLPKP